MMLHHPPLHLSAPSGGAWFFTALCIAMFAGALGWSLARARRGDPVGLVLLAGGLVASLIEAMLDDLGLLWYGTDTPLIVFHSFGVAMPLYLVLGYGFYFGSISYFTLYSLRRGKSSRYLWGIYGFALALDWALETTGGEIGLYRYFGPQPYRVLTEPLWWVFVNPALPIAAGGLFYALGDLIHGWRSLSIVALLPMVYGATYGAIGWPIFTALHNPVPAWVIWLAGAVTVAFALTYVALIVDALERYRGRARTGSATPQARTDTDSAPGPARLVHAPPGAALAP